MSAEDNIRKLLVLVCITNWICIWLPQSHASLPGRSLTVNFQSIEYVQVIAQEGSFTKAARRLHVTQQTLSAHIASLERELGAQLFVRTTPLSLTHEGQVFVEYAHRFADELRGMRQQISGPDHLQTGALRIGIAHTRGRAILPDVIERFCRTYPNVVVELREGTNAEVNRALVAGELDLAIAAFEHNLPGVEMLPYFEERVILLASEQLLQSREIDPDAVAEPLSRGDLSPLSDCPFVLGPPEDITGELSLRLLAQANFKPHFSVRSSNMETLLALALRGVGANLSPENLVCATATPEQKRGLRSYDLGPEAAYPICFGLPDHGYRWCATEDFIEMARQERAKAEAAA